MDNIIIMDEVKKDAVQEQKKEEIAPSFLDEVRKEREMLDNSRKDAEEKIRELRELRAHEILSGRTVAGQTSQEQKEEDPAAYAKRVLGR